MIPDEVVEQVQAAADIVAIISEHVRLKKVGSVYRGPCPFHQGTNANFSVVPRGGYYCFVCHEKGSVFTFVQKRLGLSFVEAVKYVGEKSGVSTGQIDETSSLNEIGELWVVRLVAIRYGGYHTRDAERLRLRSSEVVPIRKTFFTVRHGRGRDLHKLRRSIFEKLLLEGAHGWQVFPRTNERD